MLTVLSSCRRPINKVIVRNMRCFNELLLLPALLRHSAAYTILSADSLRALPSPGQDFNIDNGKILSPILKPRVPGTRGSEEVLDHLANFFTTNLPDWKLTFQNSSSTTPTSGGQQVPFRNLIATRDPPWVKDDGEVGRLALVAHYDSKLTPDGFIGATDSAAPCAMLLHAARSIDSALTRKWRSMQRQSDMDLEESKGIQILLLDGEEAFASWTDTDSLYGARAMAEEWEQTIFAAGSTYSNPLRSIDLFVLLDLLGSKDPEVPSYFKTTHWAYQHMADLEVRLRTLGLFQSSPSNKQRRQIPDAPLPENEPYFLPEANKRDSDGWMGGAIGDDHLPFMARGVQILHLIPSPFPRVWHRMSDDGEHLDMPTVEDWALLTVGFAAEWMELEGHFERGGRTVKERDEL